jgi:hypothetical protein
MLLFVMTASAIGLADTGYAAGLSADPRPLTEAELHQFLPLACKTDGSEGQTGYCIELPGYPDPERLNLPINTGMDIVLETVAYGDFTGAEQAYVSYSSNFEPHAHDLGGGILFEHAEQGWRLQKWFPGGQMKNCVAVAGTRPQKWLCLESDTGQGETIANISLKFFAASVSAETEIESLTLLEADDLGASSVDNQIAGNHYCQSSSEAPKAVLLSMEKLRASKDDTAVALVDISYATGTALKEICGKGQISDLKETHGLVRFRLDHGKIIPETPVAFATLHW